MKTFSTKEKLIQYIKREIKAIEKEYDPAETLLFI